MTSRGEALRMMQEVLRSNAHLFEKEPMALAPQVHNLLFNDYGDTGAAGLLQATARGHLASRTWLALNSRGGTQIRRAQLRVLAHAQAVCAAGWNRRMDQLLSATRGGIVTIRDARTGATIATHRIDADELFAAALSPDGGVAAIATTSGLRLIRDPPNQSADATTVSQGTPALAVAWAPSGTRLAWAEPGRVWVASVRGSGLDPPFVAAKDLLFGAPLSLCWSPDGQSLALGTPHGWRVYSSADWSILREDCGPARPAATALTWSPSSRILAVGRAIPREGRVEKSRERGLIEIADLRHPGEPATIDPSSGPVTALAWSPAANVLAASFANERGLGIYGVGTGIGATDLVSAIRGTGAPLPWESLVSFWDPGQARLVGLLRGHRQTVIALQWSPDGGRLISGSEDTTAREWDPARAEPADLETLRRGHLDRITCAAICPSGTTFATASEDTTIRFWDLARDQPGMISEKADFAIPALGWSPRSHYDIVVTGVGRRTGSLARFDEGYFRRSLRLRDLGTGRLTRLPRSGFRGKCLAWSALGDLIAAGGSRIAIWEVKTGRRLYARKARALVTAVAWSAQGNQVAWAEDAGRGTLHVFDPVASRKPIQVALDQPATALLWLDGTRCVVGFGDGSVGLWVMHGSGPERTWLTGTSGSAVTVLAHAAEPDLVIGGFADSGLRIFQAATGASISSVFLPSVCLALRSRGATLDAVDDGASRGALPAASSFTLHTPPGAAHD